MGNFRDGYLEQGAPVGAVRKDVLLSADNQVIDLDNVSAVYLQSDNTTATNRTFTLKSGGIFGHKVTFFFVSGSSYTCDLQSSGNVKLSGAWQPLQYDSLTVMWDGTYWTEVGRGNTGSGGVKEIADGVIVNADVSASAAIAFSKLATLSSGNILVGNGSNVAASVAVTGDVTITNGGVTAIGANKVLASMLASEVQVVSSTVSLTQTNITNLNATPITLVAALGAGIAIVPLMIEFFHSYSTTAYTNGGGGHIVFEYADGTDVVILNASRMTDTSSANVIIVPDAFDVASSGTGAGLAPVANSAFRITKATAEFADGHASNIAKIRVWYRAVTLLT